MCSHVDVGTFASLLQCKGGATKALENLQNVTEKRLKEDLYSAYQMKEVWESIPNSIDGLDLKLMGLILILININHVPNCSQKIMSI